MRPERTKLPLIVRSLPPGEIGPVSRSAGRKRRIEEVEDGDADGPSPDRSFVALNEITRTHLVCLVEEELVASRGRVQGSDSATGLAGHEVMSPPSYDT